MNQDIDATTSKHLRGKYAIVGVGETGCTRGSGRTLECRLFGDELRPTFWRGRRERR